MTASARVTEVVPRTLASFDVSSPDGGSQLQARYGRADAAYVRLNMITSVTGAARGADGTSDTLTSRVDRSILGAIRREADVVLVGAETVRAEGYVLPRRTRLAVLTSSGDLSGHRFDLDDDGRRVLVMCPADRARAVQESLVDAPVDVIPVPGQHPAPRDVVAALSERGHRRIVCEGGPSLASQFAIAGAVDEYCLTIAPALEPTDRPFVQLDGHRPDTEVAGMLVDDAGFVYLRLRVIR